MAGPDDLNPSSLRWGPVRKALAAGLEAGVATAVSLTVGQHGQVLYEQVFGRTSDGPVGVEVGPESLFDLASLTKPLATTLACLGLIQEGMIEIEAPLGRWLDLPEDKAGLTPAHLLTHTSGLPAWRPFYQEVAGLPHGKRADRLRDLVAAEPLTYPPGEQTLYSDLGFMLLKDLIEKVSQESLAEYAAWTFYEPLGLGVELSFVLLPDGPGPVVDQFVASERCPWRGKLLQGEVNDENAWAEGGIAGQAGLFGAGRAVFELMTWLAASAQGRGEPALLRPEVASLIYKNPFAGQARTLGFDRPAGVESAAGSLGTPEMIGHLGFVGASLFHDPSQELIVVLLTNRTIFGRENQLHQGFRREVHDLVAQALAGDEGSGG